MSYAICNCPLCVHERRFSTIPFVPFGSELVEVLEAHPDSLSVNSDQEPTTCQHDASSPPKQERATGSDT